MGQSDNDTCVPAIVAPSVELDWCTTAASFSRRLHATDTQSRLGEADHRACSDTSAMFACPSDIYSHPDQTQTQIRTWHPCNVYGIVKATKPKRLLPDSSFSVNLHPQQPIRDRYLTELLVHIR